MPFVPRPQEIYKHFKGNLYQVIAIAEHSETGEKLVIYQALYGDFKFYARELGMFTSKVDKDKYPDCTQEFRFELQGENKERQRLEESDRALPLKQKDEAEPEILERAEKIVTAMKKEEPQEDELQLDPLIVEFLDSNSYEAKLNVLAALHHRITDDMITTMAVATDVEVVDGELEERYLQLKNCLLTLEKYECNRLR